MQEVKSLGIVYVVTQVTAEAPAQVSSEGVEALNLRVHESYGVGSVALISTGIAMAD